MPFHIAFCPKCENQRLQQKCKKFQPVWFEYYSKKVKRSREERHGTHVQTSF